MNPSESLFHNNQIDIASLPRATEVEWVGLNRKYLPVSLLSSWLFGLFLPSLFLVINSMADIIEDWRIVVGVIVGWLVLFIFITLMSILGFRHKSYAIREHDILYKSGLIFRKTVALPFNRVQHSEISQGPIERYFGLSQLEIFTAGGSQSDLTIPGLLGDDAQRIKTLVMEKTATHEEQ